MFSSTARVAGWRLAGVVAAIGAFVLASAGIGSAATSGSPYQVQLDPSVQLPATALSFGTTGSCAGFVAPQDDGWHFVVPGGFTAILSLNVSFNSPFRIVFTSDRKQAYVATLAGAQLSQASATVLTLGGQAQVQNLELADTCPAAATATATPTTSSSPTATPGPFPGFVLPSGITNPFPAGLPSWLQSALSNPAGFPIFCTSTATPTASATATPTTTATATPTATPTATATATATATPTTSATATPSTSPSPCENPASAFSGATSTSSASGSSSASMSSSSGSSASASTSSSTTSSTGTAPTPSPVSSNLPVTG